MAKYLGKFAKSEIIVGVERCALRSRTVKKKAREQRSS